MATKVDDVAKLDFSAEMSEWIEAFDDVVAADWENGAELVEALRRAGARGRRADAERDDYAVPQHDSEA